MNPASLKILLVEDDEDDYLITRDLLRDIPGAELHLDWIQTFEEGLEEVNRQRHDVYLIDYRLGPHTGLELLAEAVRSGCTAPIILLTGLGDRQVDVDAMKGGAADYLVKGQISPALLERSIHHSLQRKDSERRLRESEEYYRLLFEQNPHPLWVVDSSSGQIIAVNESATQLYGYSKSAFLEMNFNQLEAESAQSGRLPLLARENNGFQGREIYHHLTKDNRVLHVELISNKIAFQGRKALLVMATDMTSRLELEASLRQTQKMESMGTLAGGIAHDFNNLLAIISGYASRLRGSELSDDQVLSSVAAIEKAVQRGAALVRQILTVARKTDVLLEPLDINEQIQDLEKMLLGTFPKTIEITLDLQPKLPLLVADSNQLNQTLLNLCVNARDAMPGGGNLCLGTELVAGDVVRRKFLDAPEKQYVCIRVKDTGTGMTPQVQARIFEPFFTTKEREKGTGLGLAVGYGIIRAHHGFIDVESEPGQGSCFRVYLPVEEAQAGHSTHESAPLAGCTDGKETILLVEDETLLQELLKALLSDKGYKIITASDGLEAVETFRRHQNEINLVLTDMGLPRLGGWEACLQMQKIRPQIPVVLASGYLDPNLKNNLLKQGARDFVQKPYVPQELFRRIRQILDSP